MIGRTLAHYEITDLLGRGGMGEVYRARDTKLGRDVALKFLPAEFVHDAERLARFEREARTLASIQDPNIAGIHGFEQVDEHRFLVMELAEGMDLAEHLASGSLQLADALDVARQIAQGLEAAHEKGIIHRDLKPANVMIGPARQVKLLDFGLARAYEDASAPEDLAHSPTITAAMTQAGVVLGTAAYMSPEQARGRPVDRRTDVWALGAVLFEMLTGRQPFPGEVVSDVIAKILEREPPWEELPEGTPPLVRRLLARCLAKDPQRRLHDVADVRLEIEDVLADPSGASLGLGTEVAGPTIERSDSRNLGVRLLPWVVALGLAVALGVVVVGRGPTTEAPQVEFAIQAPPEHQLQEFSLSPDGSALVFSAIDRGGTGTLWLRRLDRTAPTRLEGTEGAMFPFWSADSRSLAFFAGGKLRGLDLASGSLRTVADAPNGRGGAWSQDGIILFAPDGQTVLHRVPAQGGAVEPVTALGPGETTHRFPHFLPDGRRFTFSAHGPNSEPTHRYLGSLDSSELVRLPDGLSETYAPPGYLLYLREETLVAHPLDEGATSLVGEPLPLVNDLSATFPRTGRSSFSVSNRGALAYLRFSRVDSYFRWFDRDGRRQEVVGAPADYGYSALSHDGRRVAYSATTPGRGGGLWLLDLERGSSTRIADLGPNASGALTWSHDDRGILYADAGRVLRRGVPGGESAILLDTADPALQGSFLSPRSIDEAADGTFVVFDGWDPSSDYDLWMLRLEDGATPEQLDRTRRVQGSPRISPDLRWIAYESDESGRFEVYVRTPEPSAQKWQVSAEGGWSPEWSQDGSDLYYLSPNNKLVAVAIDAGEDGPEVGLPTELFEAEPAPPTSSSDVRPAPQLLRVVSDRFLFHVPAEEVPARAVEVLLNWERRQER